MKNERAIQFFKGWPKPKTTTCMKISDFEERFSQNFALGQLHILKFSQSSINIFSFKSFWGKIRWKLSENWPPLPTKRTLLALNIWAHSYFNFGPRGRQQVPRIKILLKELKHQCIVRTSDHFWTLQTPGYSQHFRPLLISADTRVMGGHYLFQPMRAQYLSGLWLVDMTETCNQAITAISNRILMLQKANLVYSMSILR